MSHTDAVGEIPYVGLAYLAYGSESSYAAATLLGTTIRQASRTISRISATSIASSRTTIQW